MVGKLYLHVYNWKIIFW